MTAEKKNKNKQQQARNGISKSVFLPNFRLWGDFLGVKH